MLLLDVQMGVLLQRSSKGLTCTIKQNFRIHTIVVNSLKTWWTVALKSWIVVLALCIFINPTANMAVLFTFVNVWQRKNKFSGVITQIQSFASSFNGAYFHTKIMDSHHDVAELNVADSKTLHFILHAASLLNSLPIFSVFIKFFLFCFLRFSGEKI